MVIECDFNINLAALTLEEVLGKRRKVVRDMCDQLASRSQQAAEAEACFQASYEEAQSRLRMSMLCRETVNARITPLHWRIIQMACVMVRS